jgi:fatty-acyl-CoA synthase
MATHMHATMMAHQLGTQMIVDRGRRLFAASQVIDFDGDTIRESSFADVADGAARLATALVAIGLNPGDRVGTFAWNSRPHLEAYLAVPAMGFVLHTVNVRLFPEQIAYIIDHAGDRAMIVDASLLDVLAPTLPGLSRLEHVIVFGATALPQIAGFHGAVRRYEDLIAAHAPISQWPEIDENSAAVACYTSGTTGNPKGVVYSHRTIFLHSIASLAVDAFGVCNADRILMLPPMFHANAWGLPFSGWLAGSDLILPGPHLQPDKIARLIAATRPTVTAAVPTILNDLLQLHARAPMDLSSFRAIVSGGSAVSMHLIERVRDTWGVDVIQGWGMTETSPMCVVSHPPRGSAKSEELAWRAKSGRPVPGVMARIVGDDGTLLPEDGATVGRLQLRGAWIAAGYFDAAPDQSPLTPDGWLETGDVGTIDQLGYVHVTDRTKDLIKSGGEWISSADLEREIARFPGIREVAVIAVPDPRWEERPLAVIATDGDTDPDYAAIRDFLAAHIARFMVPEYWSRLTNLPKTSVGKIDKKEIREEVRLGRLAYQRVATSRMTEIGNE